MVTGKTKDNLIQHVVTINSPKRILAQLGFGPISVCITVGWQRGVYSLTFVIFLHLWPGEIAPNGPHGMGFPTRKGRADTGRVLDRH